MALGLVGAGGVAGGQQALEEILAKRIAAQKYADLQRQQEIENTHRAQQLGQGQQRIALDRDEFGFRRDVHTEGAPGREAERLYQVAQTGELRRKPLAESEARIFTTARDKAEHGYRLGEIAATGSEQRRTKTTPEAGAAGRGPSPYAQERNIRNRQSIAALKGKVNRWTTGMGSLLSGIPETDARNFAAELDTLKANIAFGELTAMREASKTGGALGQVSDRELALLTSALGALDPGQSPENIRQQLQKVDDSIARWETAQAAQQMPNAGLGQVSMPGSADTNRVDELLRKYGWQ